MNLSNGSFLTSGAAVLSSLAVNAQASGAEGASSPRIWGLMMNLGHNMWGDVPTAHAPAVDTLGCDDALWKETTEKAASSGMNLLLIDLGEGIQYESHPELAIKGSWSIDKLREDLARLRKLGIEPIPKLNFSTCHDVWLGEYARMVSTPKYYEVCADLIKEVVDIFEKPRFFHLGYDEENFANQKTYDYVAIRQGELWKRDFLFFVEQVEKTGVRPWIWADYAWNHKDFYEWAPKSVVMSNWYYGKDFNPETSPRVKCYLDFDAAGFDQIPTGSNWNNDENFGKTVAFCRENLSNERLLGYLQTPWNATYPRNRDHIMSAIQQVADAKY